MSKKPILTIAIPTFNRASSLEILLKQLEKELNDDVEVLVSDNNSQDDTERLMKSYIKKNPKILYNRNKANLEFNGNIRVLYEKSRTQYIWFICDDDTITPGAIKIIVKELQKYEPTVAIFSNNWINPFGEKKISTIHKTTMHDSLATFDDYQPLMRATFLSVVVLERRKNIKELVKTNYNDNIFFQLSLVVYLLSDSFKLLEVASKPIIERNVGYKYGEFFKFNAIDHLKAVFIIPHTFDNRKFIDWSMKKIPYMFELYISRKLGLFLYSGNPTQETIRLLHKYYGVWAYLLRSLPLISFFIPTALVKILYFSRLYTIHGYKKAKKVYNLNINRVFKDKRETSFTEYK